MTRALPLCLLVLFAPFVAGCGEEEEGHDSAWHKEQGDYYYVNGRWDQAHAQYILALEKDDEYVPAMLALIFACRMQGKIEFIKAPNEFGRRKMEAKYQEALHWGNKALEEEEGNDDALHAIGILYYDAAGDSEAKVDMALEYFDRALDHNPRHSWSQYYRAWCFFLKGVKARGDGVRLEEKDQKDEAAKKFQASARWYLKAAQAMEDHLENWEKAKGENAPREGDWRNWIAMLKEMSASGGAITATAKSLGDKIQGGSPGRESGVIREGESVAEEDLPPGVKK
jgi:tetratricopeptide (TPR) repeat protein